jgi:transcription termination factor Rho
VNITELESKTRDELLDIAKELGISGVSGMKKQDLAFRLLQHEVEQQGYMLEQGVLEIMNDGYAERISQSLLMTSMYPNHKFAALAYAVEI